jgi:hypothetical protein
MLTEGQEKYYTQNSKGMAAAMPFGTMLSGYQAALRGSSGSEGAPRRGTRTWKISRETR